MPNPATKPESKRQLVKRQFQAFAKMLRQIAVTNHYLKTSYLEGVGEIIDVQLRGKGTTLAITIDSFDEPPVRSILRLTVTMGDGE